MKSSYRFIVIAPLILVVLFAFPSQALAQSPSGDQVVFGGHFTLRAGEILDGNLVVFGGSANLEHGSRVNESIAIMGGSVAINGEVRGSINVIGGSVILGDTAHVFGDIFTVGGHVTRQPGARVDGSARRIEPEEFQLPQFADPVPYWPNYDILAPIGRVLWFIFRTLAISALAVLVVLFMATPTQRVAKTMLAQPLVSGVMGFLTLFIVPALSIVLAVTIILIPLSLLAFLVLFVALIYGWIVVGVEVGDRLAAMLHTSWTMPVSAGLGTLVLTIVAGAVGQIPCIGWVLSFIVAMIGLGSVVLSRFGTQVYVPQAPIRRSSPPAPFTAGNAIDQPSPGEHDLSVTASKPADEPTQKTNPPEEALPG